MLDNNLYRSIETSATDMTLIMQIARRADETLQAKGQHGFCRLTMLMELEICHHYHPIDLQPLLVSRWDHFIHDLGGIKRNLDRNTGELKDGWTPRHIADLGGIQ